MLEQQQQRKTTILFVITNFDEKHGLQLEKLFKAGSACNYKLFKADVLIADFTHDGSDAFVFNPLIGRFWYTLIFW